LQEMKAFSREMQWWPQERVREWQWAKIKELLEHAQTAVPYYQKMFKQLGIEARDIRTWDDFACLPVLTKEDMQKNFADIRAGGIEALEHGTSGSTGQPLRFYLDTEYREWAHVSLHWGFNMCGLQGGEKQVFLWGSEMDSQPHKTLRMRLIDRAQNIRFINAFNISDQQLKNLARELSRWQPGYIWAYVSTLELLAEQVRKDGLEIHPKGIQVTAGTLYPSIREKLEQAFGKVIYNRYGSREVSIVAHECSAHQGLHEASFHNYIEVIGGNGAVPGRIVITNLHNHASPFIRYDIKDLGVLADETCSCGRSFKQLKCVVGRTVEIITSPSGHLIDGSFFTYLFDTSTGVKRFQVVQETPELLVIKIVKADNFTDDVLSSLEERIKEYGDRRFVIRFELVDHIPELGSGKRVYVLSKVPVKLA